MRVREQLRIVKEYFSEFVSYRDRGESIYAVERLAQLVIQSLLDLGALMAVVTGDEKPQTYRGVADYLARRLGLDEELRRFLMGLAGFRDVLVYGYVRINRELEEKAFRDMERYMPRILEALSRYIESMNMDPVKTPDIAGRLAPVFREFGVRFAFLFGSRARVGSGVDFDFAVVGKFAGALDLGRLLVSIAEALGVHEDYVDLVDLDGASPGVVYTMLCEGRLVYGDWGEALDYLYRRYLEVLDWWSWRVGNALKQ